MRAAFVLMLAWATLAPPPAAASPLSLDVRVDVEEGDLYEVTLKACSPIASSQLVYVGFAAFDPEVHPLTGLVEFEPTSDADCPFKAFFKKSQVGGGAFWLDDECYHVVAAFETRAGLVTGFDSACAE